MKKLFTKQLFILFNLPILIFICLSFFITKETTDAIGFNRQIKWNVWDEYLENSLYNLSVFIITYLIFPFGYFIIFLIRRITDFHLSLLHFTLSIMNLILVCVLPEFHLIIPLSIICFTIFIFNIFKTTKFQISNKKSQI